MAYGIFHRTKSEQQVVAYIKKYTYCNKCNKKLPTQPPFEFVTINLSEVDSPVIACIYFHTECFRSVAGEEYLKHLEKKRALLEREQNDALAGGV